jgi:hypothetical protein
LFIKPSEFMSKNNIMESHLKDQLMITKENL